MRLRRLHFFAVSAFASLQLTAALSAQVLEPSDGYTKQSIATRIGELTGIYPAYAACSGTSDAIGNFENLKYSVEQFFGESASAGMQERFDTMKAVMDKQPPSIRRETAIRSNCDELEQSTASRLNQLFKDLSWMLDREGG